MPALTPDYTLYLATDPDLIGARDLCSVVADTIDAGVTMVQLRDKRASGESLFRSACLLLDITRARGVPLIINDRLDVMLAAGADGVHVGTDDLPLEQVRRLAGSRALVGYSVNTAADLETARTHGADYIGIGPVFATATKPDAKDVLGLDSVRELLAAAPCPAVGIGGITAANCPAVIAAGAAGVCVISAILGTPDPAAAARAFRRSLSGTAA